MTEAWWAARVSPPSVAQMFRWLVPWEIKRLIGGILSGFGSEGGFFRLVDIVFLPLFLIPMTVLIILAFILFRILRAIPWKPLQDFAAIRAIDAFLVDWFGDMRILLTDRVQAANIRARVAEAIGDCVDAGCGTIVVIGHSGGTIVGYMTLADEAYSSLPVSTFVTHGQALTLAWRLAHFGEPEVADHHPDRLYAGDRLSDGPHEARVPIRPPVVRLLGDPRPRARRRLPDRPPPHPARGHRRPVHPRVQPDERAQRPRRLLGERRGVRPSGRAPDRPVAGRRPDGLEVLPRVLGDPPRPSIASGG